MVIQMDTVIKFADYKIFQNDEHKYMFCVLDNKIIEIDERLLELLNQDGKTYQEIKKNLSSLFHKDEFDELIETMNELNLIKNSDRNYDYQNEVEDELTMNLTTLILLVAQDCNLRCSYCYADEGKYYNHGKMNSVTAKKSVDLLFEKSVSDKLTICFFGGEPLLNFELIKEVVKYCNKKEKESGKKVGFCMTTNGTLINEEIENYIIKNNISVQISIDGDKKTHDANRYFNGKVGSFDTVLKRTKSLREKKLLDARGTVTTNEMNLVFLYDFLYSIDFKNVVLAPAFNLLTDEEYSKMADAYIDYFFDCEKRIKEKKYKELKHNQLFMSQLSYIHRANIRRKACGAGNNMCAIDINGDIYPCQRFVGSKNVCLGNVFENDNKREEFIKRTTITNFEKCSTCWIRNLCIGGCVHSNYSSTDNLNIPYEPFCEYKKKVVAEAIRIYIRLRKLLSSSKIKSRPPAKRVVCTEAISLCYPASA